MPILQITANQLVAHMIGDHLLQSHWMATDKTRNSLAAFAHVSAYVLPFFYLCPVSLSAVFIITSTHFAIDRWRLARYVIYAKNLIGAAEKAPWAKCKNTGYSDDVPPWLAVWLMIIADNILHVLCNAIAIGAFPA